MWRLLALCLLTEVQSHGFLTLPVARQPGAPGLDLTFSKAANAWYSKVSDLTVPPTICERDLLTTGMAVEGRGVPCVSADGTATKPWRSPGTAKTASPCGSKKGQAGTTLPPTTRTTWEAGAAVEVAEAITNNHGGGYAYRLCPASASPTEECFRAGHLDFADNTSTVVFPNGTILEIPARRTRSTPGSRMWSKNPIPKSEAYFPAPFPGGVGDHWPFSIKDRVLLPADLAPGDYVLSWRWDSEGVLQVWGNCADVTIVDAAASVSV